MYLPATNGFSKTLFGHAMVISITYNLAHLCSHLKLDSTMIYHGSCEPTVLFIFFKFHNNTADIFFP